MRDTTFIPHLVDILKDFDLNKAVALSDSIHEAESVGYRVTLEEDQLWIELTACILNTLEGGHVN